MRTLVSCPGAGPFAQQVARSFLDRGELDAFATTFVYRPEGALARMLEAIPNRFGTAIRRQLGRRSVPLIPASHIRAYPAWEIARTILHQAGANAALIDRVWDHMARDFDRRVARDYVPHVDAVYAYEYTALASFERARALGIATILDLPSLHSRAYEGLLRAEKEQFPELRSRDDHYFDRQFEERQARRDAEIRQADVIVANSNLTKQSHIDNGADAAKIVVVPYGAPPTIAAVATEFNRERPLQAVWAGTFGIRKGAHHFLEAWRRLRAASAAKASVYGAMELPERALRPIPDGIEFRGSVPQSELFAALDSADILLFPTLSDGFGMVVTEAFARGVPVVTTESAGAGELVRHGENGLVVPAGDAAALAEALQWCLDNRAKLHEMRFSALETARQWQWADYRRRLGDVIVDRLDPGTSTAAPGALAAGARR